MIADIIDGPHQAVSPFTFVTDLSLMISPLNVVNHPAFSRRDFTGSVSACLDGFNLYPLRASCDDPPDPPVVVLRMPVSNWVHVFLLKVIFLTYHTIIAHGFLRMTVSPSNHENFRPFRS